VAIRAYQRDADKISQDRAGQESATQGALGTVIPTVGGVVQNMSVEPDKDAPMVRREIRHDAAARRQKVVMVLNPQAPTMSAEAYRRLKDQT
jgi:hypothetical protein